VVTNCHVVEGATQITVFTSADEPEKYDARVIGGDCEHDLAVLKIDGKNLPTLPLGSSAGLRLGQSVVAIGYALALEGGPSVTTGIVSSLNRVVEVQDPNCEVCENGTRTYSDVIQTDAAINHGNSGGPLLNLRGEVIGINSAGSDTAENIGFAIAIDSARETIQLAINEPLAATGYIGVSTQSVTADMAYQLNLSVEDGAYIIATTEGGPAAEAAIESGDVITSVDGKAITNAEDLGQVLAGHEPGETVTIVVSLGPERFPAPSLVGMTRDAAVAAVRELGLVPTVIELPGATGELTVATQLPVAGTTVRVGTTITIYVG
jgi:serine protease Do